MSSQIASRTAAALVAGIAFHPVISEQDRAHMSVAEQLYFTDTPAAHIAAFEDFRRQTRLSRLATQFDSVRFDRLFVGAGA